MIEKRVGLESNENSEESDKKEVRSEAVEKFKCDLCEYESNSERGIHIHKKKKHGKIPRYPKSEKFDCDLCDKTFETEIERNIHRKTHSFKSRFVNTKWEEQVCENCGFECKSIYTMEIHIGKCNSNNYECGLCDEKFDDLTTLELHLRSCEIYECSECYKKDKDLNDMKKHFVNDHAECKEGSDIIQHLKIDSENLSEVIIKSLYLSKL